MSPPFNFLLYHTQSLHYIDDYLQDWKIVVPVGNVSLMARTCCITRIFQETVNYSVAHKPSGKRATKQMNQQA